MMKQQQGVALISVLLIVAMAVVLASQILVKQQMLVTRSANLFERQQAFWYAQGAEQFVASLLQQTIKKDKDVINLQQDWAMNDMAFPVADGMIAGEIIDLRSCFNLNSLVSRNINKNQQKQRIDTLVRYFELLDLNTEQSAQDLVNNIVDWLDEDDYPVESIGYDGDMYNDGDFPYVAANSALGHENELRLINGFDALTLSEIDNRFCVIPGNDELFININTIDEQQPEFLMAMLDISEDEATDIIGARPEQGYDNIDEFWAGNAAAKLKNNSKLDKSQFTVNSNFFKLITNAEYNDSLVKFTSIFQVSESHVAVIGRRFGGELERKADPETEQSEQP